MKAKRRNWLRKREEKLDFPVERKGNAYFTETVLLWGITGGKTPFGPRSVIKPIGFVATFKKLCDYGRYHLPIARLWVTLCPCETGENPGECFP